MRSKKQSAAIGVRLGAAAVALCVTSMQCLPVWASPAGQVLQTLPKQLNLASTNHTFVAPTGLPATSINVGGQPLMVQGGTTLTPAEGVALEQVLASGRQSIVLATDGAAKGGSFSMPVSETLSSLIIPSGVAVLRNFNGNSPLNLSASLVNAGNFYTYATAIGTTNALIAAGSLTNTSGGLITTVVPSGGLPGVLHPLAHLDLSIVEGTIDNAGTISSSRNLTLSSTSDLLINGTGGTFQALNGNIDIRNASYNGAANTTLVGGNYLSNNLNIYGGGGDVEANVGIVSGTLNTQAGTEHVIASTPNLVLGHNSVKGDPIFANDGSADGGSGNILISGTNTFSEDVAIVASGNVTDSSSAAIIDPGHSVIIVAGTSIDRNGWSPN